MSKVYCRSATGELSVEENGQSRSLITKNGALISDGMAALAILADALGDNERASALYSRFNWRVIKESKKEFRISLDRVLSVVADIETVHQQTSMTRVIVAREPVPIVSDRGGGAVWDQTHDK